jgi:hypothetical protein
VHERNQRGFRYSSSFHNYLAEIVERLVARGADLRQRTLEGWTALHLAARANALDALRALVAACNRLPKPAAVGSEIVPVAVKLALNQRLEAQARKLEEVRVCLYVYMCVHVCEDT